MNALSLWVASSDLLQRAHVGRPFAISAGEGQSPPREWFDDAENVGAADIRRLNLCFPITVHTFGRRGECMAVRSNRAINGVPLCAVVLIVLGSLGCGNSHPGGMMVERIRQLRRPTVAVARPRRRPWTIRTAVRSRSFPLLISTRIRCVLVPSSGGTERPSSGTT